MLTDRKSTRLNSSHTEIYTLSLHDALPIWPAPLTQPRPLHRATRSSAVVRQTFDFNSLSLTHADRSEEHTSELQSHRDLHSFPTRRSSDLACTVDTAETAPSGDPLLCSGPTDVRLQQPKPDSC